MGEVSGREGAKMTKGREVREETAQEGRSAGLGTVILIRAWGQGAP